MNGSRKDYSTHATTVNGDTELHKLQVQVKKYRPVLPAYLISHILHLASHEVPLSKESIEIIGLLAPFKAKIEALALTPAYTVSPRDTLMQRLGEGEHAATSMKDKVAYWKACYTKLQESLTDPSVGLTLEEIQAADEYAYLEGLMSDEEVALFETSSSKREREV